MIWDALVRWLSQGDAPNSPEAVPAKEAAVIALALISRKDLARTTASGTPLFRLPVMQQMLPASIHLICSRFSSGTFDEPHIFVFRSKFKQHQQRISTNVMMQATEEAQRK